MLPIADAELRQQPALMPGAVEEILRCYPPVPGAARVATQDTTLGGQQIVANQTVQIFLASANYDEAVFPDATHFDIRRNPNPHIAFGHGIHYCLGAPLARLEAQIALTVLLQRLAEIRRIPERPTEPVNSFLIYGVKHFWITCKEP